MSCLHSCFRWFQVENRRSNIPRQPQVKSEMKESGFTFLGPLERSIHWGQIHHYQQTSGCVHYILLPIPSMYGIFTYIWLIFMVNVGKYTIHGFYGLFVFIRSILNVTLELPICPKKMDVLLLASTRLCDSALTLNGSWRGRAFQIFDYVDAGENRHHDIVWLTPCKSSIRLKL